MFLHNLHGLNHSVRPVVINTCTVGKVVTGRFAAKIGDMKVETGMAPKPADGNLRFDLPPLAVSFVKFPGNIRGRTFGNV